MGLIRTTIAEQITLKTDLMSPDFPSIWLEHRDAKKHPTLIAGFYREWTRNGINTVESQIKRMELFSSQIEQASIQNKNMVIIDIITGFGAKIVKNRKI